MSCDGVANPMVDFNTLVTSVNNPPGQPLQDIGIQTSPRSDGGQVGAPGQSDGNTNGNGGGENANSGNGSGNSGNSNGNSGGGNGYGNGNSGNGNANGNSNRNGNGIGRPGDGTGVIGTGNIHGQKGPQPVLGGAEEVLTASLWAMIMVSTTAMLFTTIIW